MKDLIDEGSLDRYAEMMEKNLIMVPNELEERILKRIENVGLQRKKLTAQRIRRVLAAAAAVLIIFAASVKWIPGFAAYASGIPVIKYAVSFLQGDSGTELAKKKGYPELGPVSAAQNGFALTIDHIMFDEDRLVMTVRASGEKIQALLPQSDDSEKPARPETDSEMSPSPHISIKVLDLPGTGMTTHYEPPKDLKEKGYAIRAEAVFEEGQVRAFLADNPQFLTLSAEIAILTPGQEQQILQTFANIKVPLQSDKILLSKKVHTAKTISVGQTDITVNQVTISPTRMRLDVSFTMPDGYFFTAFENPYLKDSQGNIYKPEGLISRSFRETERDLFFVPSVYFDRPGQVLYFGFDGIRVGSEEGRSITLSTEEAYPQTIKYMGEELIIEEVTYNSRRNQALQVKMRLPGNLRIEGLNIDGAKSNSWGMTDAQDNQGLPISATFGADVEYRPKYPATFSFPGYLISSPHEIELQI